MQRPFYLKKQEELQDIMNKLVDSGRQNGIEINIAKSQLMRVFRRNKLFWTKVDNEELKEVDHFKLLGRFEQEMIAVQGKLRCEFS